MLSFLRAAVFFILLAILLNPFYKAESTYLENPKILVFLDNSESTTLETGSYNGLESYQKVLDRLNLADSSNIDYTLYAVGSGLKTTRQDSLRFNDEYTNLYNAVQTIKDRERDISGSILVSDGVFTRGQNPVYESESIIKPIFTIGLGDTTRQKDLIIENVSTNATGYLDTDHPIKVSIVNNGFTDQAYQIQVLKDGEVIASQNISPLKNSIRKTIELDIPLTEEGLRQYEVRIPEIEGEWTGANNSQLFAVDIIDQKQRILSLAFEVHPDVKFIRSVLLADSNTKLEKRTWLGGNRFLEGTFDVNPDSLDLIIMQGLPHSGLSGTVMQQLRAILDKVPAILLATPGSSFANFETFFDRSLPVLFEARTNFNEIGLAPSSAAADHPIMELPEVSMSQFPSLSGPISGLKLLQGATMLFETTYLGQSTAQPLVAVQELGNMRTTFISGFGWYRLAQSSDPSQRKYINTLFDHMISWTATKPDSRWLRIQPSKKIFTGAEDITLNAFLKNESGQMESNGTIDITLNAENIESRFYTMDNTGDGRYQLQVGSLPEGIYTYSAEAKKGNRIIDTQQGEFSVGKSNAEFVNPIRNDKLLRQLSANTGGNAFLFNQLEGFVDSLNKKGVLSKKEKISENLFFPYQHSFWFIIVLGLLTAEWIIRKYLALP